MRIGSFEALGPDCRVERGMLSWRIREEVSEAVVGRVVSSGWGPPSKILPGKICGHAKLDLSLVNWKKEEGLKVVKMCIRTPVS